MRFYERSDKLDNRDDDGVAELTIQLGVGDVFQNEGLAGRSNPISRAHSRGVRRRGRLPVLLNKYF